MALDEKKVEVLKVWYSIFCTIMDDREMTWEIKTDKLHKLRRLLKDESPDLELIVAQMKN
jgi:hypothetical protein